MSREAQRWNSAEHDGVRAGWGAGAVLLCYQCRLSTRDREALHVPHQSDMGEGDWRALFNSILGTDGDVMVLGLCVGRCAMRAAQGKEQEVQPRGRGLE